MKRCIVCIASLAVACGGSTAPPSGAGGACGRGGALAHCAGTTDCPSPEAAVTPPCMAWACGNGQQQAGADIAPGCVLQPSVVGDPCNDGTAICVPKSGALVCNHPSTAFCTPSASTAAVTCCTSDADCDDSDPCTADACLRSGGCAHVPTDAGAACSGAPGPGGICAEGICCTP